MNSKEMFLKQKEGSHPEIGDNSSFLSPNIKLEKLYIY